MAVAGVPGIDLPELSRAVVVGDHLRSSATDDDPEKPPLTEASLEGTPCAEKCPGLVEMVGDLVKEAEDPDQQYKRPAK